MTKRLLDMEECAEYLGLTKNAVAHMVVKKTIPYVKLGSSAHAPVRFDIEALDRFIKENSVEVKGDKAI